LGEADDRFEAIVEVLRILGLFMAVAPWKVFSFQGEDVIIDVDGGISHKGITAHPFPCEITNAVWCNAGLVATWVDHELRLARMALIDFQNELEEGISRSELRLRNDNVKVAGSSWSHSLDAEPIAMVSNGNYIIFALYTRGVYCIDVDSTELWRQPLIGSEESKIPNSNSIAEITVDDEIVTIWTRGGRYRTLSVNTGDVLAEKSLPVECDIESVFSSHDRFLISSKDGWVWELIDDNITVARKLRGTIQDAIYHDDEWRIISWREDILLSNQETVLRDELGIQVVIEDDKCIVIDNQGVKTPHMG